MRKYPLIVGLLFSFIILTVSISHVFASSENWVEVTRFTGLEEIADITTEPFTCNHVEWRIRWYYSPERAGFFITNVFDNETDSLVTQFGRAPTLESENGTLSFNENGTFYLQIGAYNIYSYLIVVEQNIESIPEFSSNLFLVFIVVASLTIIITKKVWRKIS